jgi:mono/diheme cytochrome c family protein
MASKNNIFIILSLVFICNSCGPNRGKQESFALKIKIKQYYINGKRLYKNHCSNCHQENGSGLVRLYPPINNMDYYRNDPDRIICIIRNGLKGEIFVNGISFNQPMPENKDLTNLEMAELVTYLYGKWGKQSRLIKPEEVAKVLEDCSP